MIPTPAPSAPWRWMWVDSRISRSFIPPISPDLSSLSFPYPLTEVCACPICGGSSYRIISEQPDFQFFTDPAPGLPSKRADLCEVQCNKCGALYKNPRYSAHGMQQLFAEAGQSYGHASHAPSQVEWLRSIGLLDECGSVLDVGCGRGNFLSLLPHGCDRYGIEPDKSLSPSIAHNGATAVTIEHAPLVDLITMWHVLEHVPSPIDALLALRSVTHLDTRLVIEVPVLERGATADVTGFFSPQHVTHFSIHTLRIVLAQTGWDVYTAEFTPGYNGYRVVASPTSAISPSKYDGARAPDVAGEIANLAWYSMQQWDRLINVERRIDALTSPRCVIWGAGMHTESLYQLTSLFRRDPHRQYLLVDRDPVKCGKTWRGVHIVSPDALVGFDWSQTQLLISSFGDQLAMLVNARVLDVPDDRIVTLYTPDSITSY